MADLRILLTERPDLVLTIDDDFIGSAYSPTVEVTEIEGGHRVTITSKGPDGIKPDQFDVLDGVDGKDGADGKDGQDGADGKDGVDGQDGYSPTATVTKSGDTATITITDKNGETTASVSDGKDGADGSTGPIGPQGADGFSPTVTIESTASAHTVTITDAQGPHSYTVDTYADEWEQLESDVDAATQAATDAATLATRAAASAANSGNVPYGSLTGEVVSADDAWGAPAKGVGVRGKSEQVQTTGKNLFDKSTAASGYLRTDGTIASSSTTYHSDYINVSGLTNVTCNALSTVSTVGALVFYDADKQFLSSIAGNSGQSTRTEEVPNNAAYVRISFTYSYIDRVQLESGTTATDYEPYTGGKASPNPDYPQEIVSVDGCVLNICGKNLLEITTQGNNYYTVNSDGSITYAGDTTQHQIDIGTVKVYAGVTYHLSGCPSGGSTSTYRMYPALKPESWYDTGSGATFTPTENETLTIRIFVTSTSSQQYAGLVFKPQLEVGSTATEFKKYSGQSVQVLDQPLRSLPDGTEDKLTMSYIGPSEREGWGWYSREVTRPIAEMVLDGSTTVSRSDGTETTDGTWRFQVSYTDVSPVSTWGDTNHAVPAYCDRLASASTSALYYGRPDSFGMYLSYFYLRVSGIATVNEMKAWLAENPITVQHPIAPITEILDPIELPILPNPVTIWGSSTVTPTLDVEYERSTDIVIKRLESLISDLATS